MYGTSAVTDGMGFVTGVPASRFRLFLTAGSIVMNGQIPIFPLKRRFAAVSHRGRVTADENIAFVFNRLLRIVL